jgi:hypothetical protein
MRAPMVHACDLILIDRQPLEGVHSNQDRPCASVDEVHSEPLLNVGYNRSFIKGVQVVHVLHALCLLLRCTGQQPQRLILSLAPPVQRARAGSVRVKTVSLLVCIYALN